MDNIGDVVYILVFIIWFLYRVFGKKGKKPSKPGTPPNTSPGAPDLGRERRTTESTPPPVTFEDILRELTGAPVSTPKPEPKAEDIPESFTIEYDIEPEPETSFEVLEPEISIPPAPGPALNERFKEFEVKKSRSSKAARAAFKMLKTKQGARQAFIMKEIFDRKY